ncbi:MAG: MBL fold metallo-hydrolase [Boseongicola sp. SB0673_bin_14]|nr:MBL fold metallo-hydrolase [Boseongicola sp. SB0667_bin_21]MYI68459.1 MBL fold metallo-hydrolase [Boseongicola sp. SB0673_bin_14]
MGSLDVTLLGTGTPNPNPDRAGASYLFRAADFRFMIDCGPGALLRLGQAGANASDIDHMFFTHYHLDHWADFGPFLVNRWIQGNRTPLRVYGPAGLQELVSNVLALHRRDLEYRRQIRTEPKDLPEVVATEIDEGFVFDHQGLTVAPFDVAHYPIGQPFGFRVEARGRKIVFSGDTCPNDNLIRHALDADALIHECVEYGAWTATDIAKDHMQRAHTPPAELGRMATEARARLCVTTHMLAASQPDELHRQIRQEFSGPLVIGQDLMTL